MGALAQNPFIIRMAATGALRRMEPRVAAVALIVTTLDDDALASHAIEQAIEALAFVRRDGIGLRLEGGIPLELTVMAEDPAAFLAAQVAQTASPAHRAAVEATPVSVAAGAGLDEETWYLQRGLTPLPPELRGSPRLDPPPPDLVGMDDIQGLFGLRASLDRGHARLGLLVDRAHREGYRWAVFTLPVGSTPAEDRAALDACRAQAAAAEQAIAAAEQGPFRVFLGLEVRVAPGGVLEVDDSLADAADLLVLASGSGAGASAADTAAALSHPRVKVLGHPRIVDPWVRKQAAADAAAWDTAWDETDWDDHDWEQVIRSAADHGVALEFSGAPAAAWIPDSAHERAHEHGVSSLPSADTDDLGGIDDLLCAVGGLRRARWPRSRILAARDAADFAAWLQAESR